MIKRTADHKPTVLGFLILFCSFTDLLCTVLADFLTVEFNQIIGFMAENTGGSIFLHQDFISSCKDLNLVVFSHYIEFFSDLDRKNNSPGVINASDDSHALHKYDSFLKNPTA